MVKFFIQNFIDEVMKGSAGGEISQLESGKCGGEWKLPHDCNVAKGNCEYSAQWEYLGAKRGKDGIRFTIHTADTDKWTGIGFSDDLKMVNSFFLFIYIL